MEIGPILRFELRRAARQPRTYLVRAAIGFGLLAILWLANEWRRETGGLGAGTAGFVSPMLLRTLAERLVFLLMLVQGLAIGCLIPALVAGSVAEDDRRGTMKDVLGSPLPSRMIVIDKLVVPLIRAGEALGVGLPFILPLVLIGIVDRSIVTSLYLILAAWTVFVASSAILAAVLSPRPRLAILASYALLVAWLGGPVGLNVLTAWLPGSWAWLGVVNDWAWLGHPIRVIRPLAIALIQPFDGRTGLFRVGSELAKVFVSFVGVQLSVSVLFVFLAVRLLRPMRLGPWVWTGRRRRVRGAPPSPPIGDDPMLWKERYATGVTVRRLLRWAFLVLGFLLLVPQFTMVGEAFREWRDSSWGAWTVVGWRREVLNESLRLIHETLCLVGFIGAAAVAAASVTGEREGGTWTSLATTLVTGREVARAKVLGSLSTLRSLAIPLLIVWTIGLATGSVHPLGVLGAAVGLAVYLGFAVAVGVAISMVSSSSPRAVGGTLLALLTVNVLSLLFVPSDLIRTLTGSWSTVYLAGSTPFMAWASLASPTDIQNWLAGRLGDQYFSLPGGVGRIRVELHLGLVRTYAISLLVHALVAAGLTWAAARAFDTGRGRC